MFRPETLLIFSTVTLISIGIIEVFSVSTIDTIIHSNSSAFTPIVKQIVFVFIGLSLSIIISRINFGKLQLKNTINIFATVIFFLMIAMQFLLIKFGVEVNGNKNWLRFAGVQFQPSEFLKIALIFFLASITGDKISKTRFGKAILFGSICFSCVTIYCIGRDLGTCFVILIIGLGVFFLHGVTIKRVVQVLSGIGLILFLLIIISTHTKQRFLVTYFGICGKDVQNLNIDIGVCFQSIRGLQALGNGGLFGKGVGNSILKWGFLPEAQNDFIFAIIGEEFGFLGTMTILILFLLLITALFRLIKYQNSVFYRTITVAVMIWIGFQAIINIGACIWLFPIIGVPLPFISQGGSSIISSMIAIGLVYSGITNKTSYKPNVTVVKSEK